MNFEVKMNNTHEKEDQHLKLHIKIHILISFDEASYHDSGFSRSLEISLSIFLGLLVCFHCQVVSFHLRVLHLGLGDHNLLILLHGLETLLFFLLLEHDVLCQQIHQLHTVLVLSQGDVEEGEVFLGRGEGDVLVAIPLSQVPQPIEPYGQSHYSLLFINY